MLGCPDSDGDGIADKADECPKQPGIAAFYGCPDTDGDGMPDKDDGCPNEAGPTDNNGCPRKIVPPLPTPAPERIILPDQPIQFETGSTVVRKTSYVTIDKIVAILKENPDVNVMVDGFADITGTDKINERISKARAQAVTKFLIGKGVAKNRIITVGHGTRMPVGDNKTRAGRAMNRRVEVNVKD